MKQRYRASKTFNYVTARLCLPASHLFQMDALLSWAGEVSGLCSYGITYSTTAARAGWGWGLPGETSQSIHGLTKLGSGRVSLTCVESDCSLSQAISVHSLWPCVGYPLGCFSPPHPACLRTQLLPTVHRFCTHMAAGGARAYVHRPEKMRMGRGLHLCGKPSHLSWVRLGADCWERSAHAPPSPPGKYSQRKAFH